MRRVWVALFIFWVRKDSFFGELELIHIHSVKAFTGARTHLGIMCHVDKCLAHRTWTNGDHDRRSKNVNIG